MTICDVISWINTNDGFFSLMLATIAICISIDAISSQNRAAVFDKRLEIYLKVENVYTRSAQILKLFDAQKKISKSSLAELMLDRGSRLYDLAQKVMEKESQLKKAGEDPIADPEFDDLAIEYYEYYLQNEDVNAQRQVELFFKDSVSAKTSALFDSYSYLKSEFLVAPPDELNTMIEKIRIAVAAIEEANSLGKMRKTFPL